ncbi:hypothetical protein Peur_064470 [Populus x canadensis]
MRFAKHQKTGVSFKLLIDHGIPASVADEMLAGARRFHEEPQEVRHQNQWIDVPSAGSSSNKYRGLNDCRYVIVYAATVLFEFVKGRQPACLGQARKVEFKYCLAMKQSIDHMTLSLERTWLSLSQT